MSKTVLGILIGILIFIAAGFLAAYWVGKMRRDMEERKLRVAEATEAQRSSRRSIPTSASHKPAQ
jgi:H+/gluconate symporter-like permease